ncbi:hypothetical protein P1059_00298 [Pasteurella multocida subsp. gallicida P1059]|nr:hypothetical protein PMCN06_1021 [Pasteurella multocida subsp. multocida str. HN06]AHE64418.1 hypothetical protein PMCN03_0963 [Pasteurella multocida subsp. multocida str. HB03]EJZ80935.1 hypothetical protein P1059_00298 [Pasteurella multocida subsp. gallicida P1059]
MWILVLFVHGVAVDKIKLFRIEPHFCAVFFLFSHREIA